MNMFLAAYFPVKNLELLLRNQLYNIFARHRKKGIRWTRLNEIENKAVLLIRPGFIWDIKKFFN